MSCTHKLFFYCKKRVGPHLLYNAKSCKDFAKYLYSKRVGLGPANKLLHFHPFTKKETNVTYQCDVGSFSKREKENKKKKKVMSGSCAIFIGSICKTLSLSLIIIKIPFSFLCMRVYFLKKKKKNK